MTKDFLFELKGVDDAGTFEGWLSVYGVVDLGNDMIQSGAFTKTIKENGGKVPMLWQHDTKEPIGSLELEDRADGLWVKGTLLMDSVQRAKEAYALIKADVIRGLSIGYKAIADKTKVVKGVRHLGEVKLFEGSIVTFPMLPVAQIATVKSEAKGDFMQELDRIETWARRSMMMDALWYSLDSIIYSNDPGDDKITQTADTLEQFRSTYLAFLPKFFEMTGMKAEPVEAKAGRRISAATRAKLEEAAATIQALLADEGTSEEEAAPKSAPVAASIEPDAVHSLLSGFRDSVVSALRA